MVGAKLFRKKAYWLQIPYFDHWSSDPPFIRTPLQLETEEYAAFYLEFLFDKLKFLLRSLFHLKHLFFEIAQFYFFKYSSFYFYF